MRARIYRPMKTAMQSGKARTHNWVLEFEPEAPVSQDPLMGWSGSADMRSQVELEFDTAEDAVAYARKHGLAHQVFEPSQSVAKPKSYSDNFRYDRKIPWSH